MKTFYSVLLSLLLIAGFAMVTSTLFDVPFLAFFIPLLLVSLFIKTPQGSMLETIVKPLSEQLAELKMSLENSLSVKAKGEVETQLKSIQESITKLEGKADKTLVETLQTSLNEIKSSTEKITAWQVTKDEADKKNQEALDNLIAQKQATKLEGKETKSFGQAINDAFNEKDTMDLIEKMATNHKDRQKRFVVELKAVGDITTANVTGSSLYGAINRSGIIEQPKRKVHVRDLVPVAPVGPGNTYTFMRENGDGEGAIAPVAEGAAKPQLDFDLVETTIQVETIAGYVRFTKKAMNNIPGFIAFLQSRLPEKLLRVEDAQLLSGDGVSPNISGILDAGNFTAASTTATVLVEAIIDSIAQLEGDEERDANGILLQPVDYYSFFKNKASGSGEYDLPQNVTFVNGVLYISGVPVFVSTAQTTAKYIVGDWKMGAQLLVQNAMRIEFFEQDADNVTKNKITARIEEDIAFPIYGDNYFIVGDVPAA